VFGDTVVFCGPVSLVPIWSNPRKDNTSRQHSCGDGLLRRVQATAFCLFGSLRVSSGPNDMAKPKNAAAQAKAATCNKASL
jgi:hypothetical protein